jgi:hypothetical protein
MKSIIYFKTIHFNGVIFMYHKDEDNVLFPFVYSLQKGEEINGIFKEHEFKQISKTEYEDISEKELIYGNYN